jgi:hypothetical protein
MSGAVTPDTSKSLVWTGRHMVVWGGTIQYLNTGGRYCACAPAPYFLDADGDGFGDSSTSLDSCGQPDGYVPIGGDCDDADTASWGLPSEATGLVLGDDTSIGWSPPVSLGASSVVYDVLRSGNPDDFVSGTACVTSDGTDTASIDPDNPDLGRVFAYLVRAQSDCPNGMGPLALDSSGTPRYGRACP